MKILIISKIFYLDFDKKSMVRVKICWKNRKFLVTSVLFSDSARNIFHLMKSPWEFSIFSKNILKMNYRYVLAPNLTKIFKNYKNKLPKIINKSEMIKGRTRQTRMTGTTNQTRRKGTKKETKKKTRRIRKASKNLMTVKLILMMKTIHNMKQINNCMSL